MRDDRTEREKERQRDAVEIGTGAGTGTMTASLLLAETGKEVLYALYVLGYFPYAFGISIHIQHLLGQRIWNVADWVVSSSSCILTD
jgi:hypothetical protein